MYFTAVLMVCIVYAGDEECQAVAPDIKERLPEPLTCYQCLTNSLEHFCADPFNESHPLLETIECDGLCVKWVREPVPGKITMTRTCSTKLNILMNIYNVCMRESRPAKGQICFCNTPKCNRIAEPHQVSLMLLTLCLLGSVIMNPGVRSFGSLLHWNWQ